MKAYIGIYTTVFMTLHSIAIYAVLSIVAAALRDRDSFLITSLLFFIKIVIFTVILYFRIKKYPTKISSDKQQLTITYGFLIKRSYQIETIKVEEYSFFKSITTGVAIYYNSKLIHKLRYDNYYSLKLLVDELIIRAK